ncbi:MAG: nucleotide exchange factor GrpE [Clostridia bacterium]|nr:nucleotide exchange factor GrpE [Clostridia bacterium]
MSTDEIKEEQTGETVNAEEKPEEEKKTKKGKKKEEKKNDEAEKKIEELEKNLAAATDAHMRTLAEYDNYRKRTTKEKAAAYTDAKADIMKELLAVLDNIDRSRNAPADDLEAYKAGVEMIFTSFTAVLEKAGLEQFGEKGDKFDPMLHNAVMHIEDEELGDETVAEVFAKGYKLGERILRPAMVKAAN